MSHPVIVILGHPNEGKSSVLSTLTEDDSVRVSPFPGETTRCQHFPIEMNGECLLEFVDTPGFQNPQSVLGWMLKSGLTDDSLLREFLTHFGDDPDYAHDCELLRPLLQYVGVILVVDCSRPLLEVDLAEMEILRLVNRPRMAIINFKEHTRHYLDEWKDALRRHFNTIREFNAHQAGFRERIALLQTLKAIQQDWDSALDRTIEVLHRNWEYRRKQSVALIVDFLAWAIRHRETRSYMQEQDTEWLKEKCTKDYHDSLRKREQRMMQAVRALYKHHLHDFVLPDHSVLREDLFSDETWQVLGLNKQQLIMAAAGAGAGAGVFLDAATAGITFGVFTALGATLGGGGALLHGKTLARAKIQQLPLGGVQIVVGPNKNPQFPYILLDRSLLYYREIANHAHGRRDQSPVNTSEPQMVTSSSCSKETLGELSKCFRELTSSSPTRQEGAQAALAKVLLEHINE